MKLNIAIIQMQIWDGDKEKNLDNALKILESLTESNNPPDIVCLPELFTTGFDLRKVESYAEEIPGKTIEKILKISQNKFIVIGTILELEKGKYYNTAFILGKNGELIAKYRKVHLFSPMLEKEFITPGDNIKTHIISELNDLKVGIAICYDLRFPELFRIMALQGAEIIFVPSEFPSPKKKIWTTLLHARAIENQIYIIGVNRCGKGKSDDFFGYSLVSNGNYIDHLSDNAEVKVFTIDLNTLEPIRQKIPLLKDRRTDLYNL
ncbi:MAG: nitrilase-related carbon-nitrogen hydrolase [Promethearchaeota archaeon]